uniref:Uncharacterized LOC107577385 n=1 Tax=Sinocyclocheilus grahami TaxID=75366 RepID=A0A672KKH5_SINGR
IKQLQRDIEGTRKGSLLTSNCTGKLKCLCERFRNANAKGRWASCFEGLGAEGKETKVPVYSQKKRKSDNMDHDGDAQEDHQSKRVKMDFCPGEEERLTEEEEPKMRTSQLDQSAASVSQARSDALGSSKNLPDHMKALIEPVLQKGHTGSAQAELLCKLVVNCLEPHHRLLVFRAILGVSWDEGVLSIIHALLDSKLELSEKDFSLFTDQLCSQSPHFSKSMKFAKMLLSVLTKYQSHVNPARHHTLSSCLSFNETFLKKSLQAALKGFPFSFNLIVLFCEYIL